MPTVLHAWEMSLCTMPTVMGNPMTYDANCHGKSHGIMPTAMGNPMPLNFNCHGKSHGIIFQHPWEIPCHYMSTVMGNPMAWYFPWLMAWDFPWP